MTYTIVYRHEVPFQAGDRLETVWETDVRTVCVGKGKEKFSLTLQEAVIKMGEHGQQVVAVFRGIHQPVTDWQ